MAETVIKHDGRDYTEDQLFYLINEIKDYQIVHGSLIKGIQFETESSVPSRPVGASILPTPFPRSSFEEACELQQAFNELYMRASSDPDWLYSILEPLMGHDDLFAALWETYIKVRGAGVAQNAVCAIFRSDYMLHKMSNDEEVSLKQVEMNTFSCAGACHADRIAAMQHHLARVKAPEAITKLGRSKNTQSIVNLLKTAHETYKTNATSDIPKCVLITVQPFNFNIADERPIEHGLWDAGVPCYRCEWQNIRDRTILTEDRTLLFRPPIGIVELEVSVVYHRAGYEIEEYDDQGREARLRLEMSRAIKCPDILTHLTGFKSVQQALIQEGAVERFLPPDEAAKVRKTFMPMQILDTQAAGLEARKTALDPERAVNYILKPNLEGGGHNVYRSDIAEFLKLRPQEEWHKYVLMRLIEPPPSTGTIVMPEALYHGAVVSELGILGTCLWQRRSGAGGELEIKHNEVVGWTFKTKPAGVDEMSVVKGYGVFDCPLLVD
ncbi:hypothetical protein LTR37_007893 [Vermiconidia calcicola]|uniref:Uncharacterized protein n=1 Tax=Vermiconidia calcicola TaxID=1690605 RepID=A0ACC3NCU9_9PEZI|nr:hypothetical protein LTR37_007893 [Vermiconidia calcicola]